MVKIPPFYMFQFANLEEKRRQRIEQLINLCHRYVAKYSVVSVDPLIFFMQISPNLTDFIRDYKFLFDSLKSKKAFVICNTSWHFEVAENIAQLEKLLVKFKNEYPNFTFIFLCNTLRQLDLFKGKGINAAFCNNNCFIDEKIFFPLSDTQKKYDAVYDARLVAWKRHYLASEIDSLGLIYYAIPWLEDNSYMENILRDFAHARFFNHTETGECKKLNPPEINQILNECRIGLCLSAEEGAMYASMQYLLAGLPIVTTPSTGGRDVFFDDEIALIVEPTPEAMKRGVKEMIGRNLSPARVREKTLKTIMEHRPRFISLIQNIYEQEGIDRDFSKEWNRLFFNKLLGNLNHLEIVEQLKS